MGMVVRTNTMAINAQRQLNLNNNAVSKSLEKLASGYKINRAADDAAGLAISERMKAQIVGLEAASSNSQDGISVVQTAEGALNEVHDMLNRMVELATKAANGVYTDTQRSNYADEVAQLQDEIDRIAESTNFNGIKLLDGTMGMNTGAITVVGKQIASEAGSIATTGWGSVGTEQNVNTILHVNSKEAAASSFTIDLNRISGSVATGNTLTLNVGGKDFTITMTAGGTVDATAIGTAINTAFGGANTVTFAGTNGATVTFQYQVTGGTITLTMQDAAVANATDAQLAGNMNVSLTANAQGDTLVGTQDIAITNVTAGNKAQAGAMASATFDFDVSRIADGATLQVGNTTYTFAVGKDSTVTGNNVIDLKHYEEDQIDSSIKNEVYTLLSQASFGAANRDWDIGVNGNGKLTITENAQFAENRTDANPYTTESGIRNSVIFTAPAQAGGTTLRLTSTALKEGDTINVNGNRFTFTKNAANTGSSYVQIGTGNEAITNLQNALQSAGFTVEQKTNGDLFISYANTAVDVLGSGLTLQVGDTSDDFNKLNVSVSDMHAEAIGVAAHQIDITTQEGAGAAIDIINNAIDSVSRTRSSLGAIQNRLEHTINSLDTTTENLQSANSRIRDTDMAKEMMEYTKMNVLVQSAQAMLAQANQQPQSVLQLLQ